MCPTPSRAASRVRMSSASAAAPARAPIRAATFHSNAPVSQSYLLRYEQVQLSPFLLTECDCNICSCPNCQCPDFKCCTNCNICPDCNQCCRSCADACKGFQYVLMLVSFHFVCVSVALFLQSLPLSLAFRIVLLFLFHFCACFSRLFVAYVFLRCLFLFVPFTH